jgi:hypothetical protein
MPWLMQAAARGETGRESGFGEGAELCVATTAGTAGAVVFSATLGDFTSSFFHIRHLDIEKGFSKSRIAGLVGKLRLGRVNILQDLAGVNKNGG